MLSFSSSLIILPAKITIFRETPKGNPWKYLSEFFPDIFAHTKFFS